MFNGSQTGVGESCNEITSVVIVDSEGRDVSSQYVVKCQKGRLVLVDASGNDAALSYETATVTADTISNAAAGTGALAVASGSASLSSSLDPVLSNGEAASNAAAGASVMGARMSATGDLTTDLAMRLIIIIGSMLFFGTKSFLLKKVK